MHAVAVDYAALSGITAMTLVTRRLGLQSIAGLASSLFWNAFVTRTLRKTLRTTGAYPSKRAFDTY